MMMTQYGDKTCPEIK